MRRACALATGVYACLFLVWTAQAQQPVPVNPGVAKPFTPALGVPEPALGQDLTLHPSPSAGQPECPGDKEALFSIDVLLGQECGVRSQFAVQRGDHEEVVAEVFYGALLHPLGSSEAAGVGGRYLLRRGSADNSNAIVLGPGFDLFYQFNHDHLILVNPSLELSWLHGFGDRCGWEIGVNTGVGVGVGGRRCNGDPGAGAVTPLISVYTGFRF